MKKTIVFFAPLIFFLTFSLYFLTALPSTYWRDTPEFQATSFLLDIAHPAGSPFYASVVKLFTFIPIGSIAFKTTLVSVLFGSGLSVLVYLIICSILLSLFEQEGEGEGNILCVLALISTLFFSFSNGLWENANATEVYSLQNFFTALFILILLKTNLFFQDKPLTKKQLLPLFLSLSFLLGLGLGAHAILILYLPPLFFLVYFIWIKPHSLSIVKTYSRLFSFFLLGFSVYIYLPIRSAQNPFYDWSNPETLGNFLIHVTDRKDAGYHFSLPEPILSQLGHFTDLLVDNFSWTGLAISCVGFFYLASRKKAKCLVLLGIFAFPPFLFFVRYWRDNSAYIPIYMIVTILFSVGAYAIYKKVDRWRTHHDYQPSYSLIFPALLGFQLFSLFSSHLVANAKSDYWAARDIHRLILNNAQSNAIIFMANTYFGLNYLQQVVGMRPDVTLMSVSDFLQPDVFTEVKQEKYPNVVVPVADRFRLGPIFIKKNIEQHPIYWEPSVHYNHLVSRNLIPEGFLFRLAKSEIELDEEANKQALNKFMEEIFPHTSFYDDEEKIFYYNILIGRGSYYFDLHYFSLAIGHFKMARTLVTYDSWVLKMIGASYLNLNQLLESEAILMEALLIDSQDSEVYRDLGTVYLYQEKKGKAEESFMKAITIKESDPVSNYALGEIQEEKGAPALALHYYQKAYDSKPDYQDVQAKIKRLKAKIETEKVHQS